MLKFISDLLRKLADLLYYPTKADKYPLKIWGRTVELINAADTFTDASGEFKRHKVYAQLIKEFPELRHRDIALLIEVVMQERV